MRFEAVVRHVIERLYTDTFTAYRYVPTVGADATTEQRLSDTPFIVDQKCRISFVPNRQENPKDTEVDANPILTQPKLICAPDLGLQVGDYVYVQRRSVSGDVLQEYSGPIGLPALYPSHLECHIGEVRKV